MKITFFGAPGSGKGTYASRASKILGIPHISTGDIFREHVAKETELGKKIKPILEKGELVPDEIVIEITKQRLSQEDCKNGFILDGMPRTLNQAKALDEFAKIDKALNIEVPEEVIIRRLSSRRICPNCGAVYNILTLKPKVEGICDKCGAKLIQREDDKEEAIRKRLEKYRETAQEVLDYYKKDGRLYTVEWKKELVPEGEIDIPIEVMLEKIIRIIKE